MMAQVIGKSNVHPLLYDFFSCVCSTTYKAQGKYFCHPLLYSTNGSCSL